MHIIPIDEPIAVELSKIKSFLRKKGELIENFDILIAATAIVNDLIVATNNTRHFSRINTLAIENWTI
jgi:tRNA(fMet)-specific endonuclease VapC